jgi:hypothetical protein
MALNMRRNWSFRGVFLKTPEHVLTGNQGSLALAVKAMQFPSMRYQQALYLTIWHRRQQLPSVQIMLDSPEDPWFPLSRSTTSGIMPWCSRALIWLYADQ